eukprot:6526737-Karenia_brevis.AAC.1
MAQQHSIDTYRTTVYRRVFGLYHNNPTTTRYSDQDVLLMAGKCDAGLALTIARLRYFPRMLKHGPQALLQLLLALHDLGPGTYVDLLLADLNKLVEHVPE